METEFTKYNPFIERCSKHLESFGGYLASYKFWIDSEIEMNPDAPEGIRDSALGLLSAVDNTLVLRSAIQALAFVGSEGDKDRLEELLFHTDSVVVGDVKEAIKHLELRFKELHELFDEVNDQETFMTYAWALAQERDKASMIEESWGTIYDGALGWKNGDIQSFIGAGLYYFEKRSASEPLEWKDLAQFLFHGKIIE